jgi:hypothetical protein
MQVLVTRKQRFQVVGTPLAASSYSCTKHNTCTRQQHGLQLLIKGQAEAAV